MEDVILKTFRLVLLALFVLGSSNIIAQQHDIERELNQQFSEPHDNINENTLDKNSEQYKSINKIREQFPKVARIRLG